MTKVNATMATTGTTDTEEEDGTRKTLLPMIMGVA
ncbi:hypothetical protein A2U01_0068808, partial [Trifolium medium]|nr:hypothetical protein [Trifolium medium]